MEKPKVGDILTKYTWQIIAVIFFIIVMWLNTNYVTVDSFSNYKTQINHNIDKNESKIDIELKSHIKESNELILRIQALEFQSQSNKNEILVLKRRIQIYIDRYGDLSVEMNKNENNIIILQTEMKYFHNLFLIQPYN